MIEDKFDLTYYSGQDLYSDGDVEDELLKCVQNPQKIEEELLTGNSWPHLYHLSNIRENVLEWYDFKEGASVLEIGSGCGAVTGLLCSKADHVVAIDLSKRRSMINATRNEQYNNLKIMLGNFEDIKLTEKFDYVTLIGVFEYSIYYINSENPFMDMLKKAKSFLKPDGKLIIAIENKYGLKYFSGASEDHSGRLFDGIENYAAVDRVRTFSRGTLLKMLSEAGFGNTEVYYPMPDYKLPSQVFSDDYKPGFGSLRDACISYDRDRYELFDERLAFDTICEDGMFGEFANSFIMISDNCKKSSQNNDVAEQISLDAEKSAETNKVLYAKYNRLRKPEFQISTRIVDGDTKYVEKKALRKEAQKHISNLEKNYEFLNALYLKSNKKFAKVLPVELIDDKAKFAFVKGESLEKKIHSSVTKYHTSRENIINTCKETIERIYPSDVKNKEVVNTFVKTTEFEEIFGKYADNQDYEKLTGMKCLSVSNVDCIFSNFVVNSDNELICLDYEWVFDFPIPLDYLKYRTLYYYYCENRPYIEKYTNCADFLLEFGIDKEMSKIFACMDNNYQQYVHGENRKYIYTNNYGKKVTNIGKNMQFGEQWFLSVMDDLNDLNHNLGPFNRDLVRANIKMYRKSNFFAKWKRRLSNPKVAFDNFMRRFNKE